METISIPTYQLSTYLPSFYIPCPIHIYLYVYSLAVLAVILALSPTFCTSIYLHFMLLTCLDANGIELYYDKLYYDFMTIKSSSNLN